MDNLRYLMAKAVIQKPLPDCLKATVAEIESRYGVTLASKGK